MSALPEKQYATGVNLEARIALHARFTPAGKDIWVFVWQRYGELVGSSLLEVGCATGAFWKHSEARISKATELVVSDRSAGMVSATDSHLRGVRERVAGAVADAALSPFADESFDITLSHFMLYYVTDKSRALRELRRVTRTAGWVGIV